MVTATEQSEIEVAKAALAEAKKRLAAAEEEHFGPRRRYDRALKEVLDAHAVVARLTEVRMQGGVKI